MRQFMDESFLLHNDTAAKLFHDTAAKLPIIDYHCHVSPHEIAEDKQFDSITQVWLGGDHYKWRAMRAMGISEELITGSAKEIDKFRAWAKTIPMLIANPLYHWTHLELQRYFNITAPLSEENADEIFHQCNEMLKQKEFSVRGIIKKSNVSVICTTDDPVDNLDAHIAMNKDGNCPAKVYPAFRPDKAINIHKESFAPYMSQLEQACEIKIKTLDDLKQALCACMDYFTAQGCKVSDHALDTFVYRRMKESELNAALTDAKNGTVPNKKVTEAFQTEILLFLAEQYHNRHWVMQIHFGCLRNVSSSMFKLLGPDTGYDSMHMVSEPKKIARFFDALEQKNTLPKTILYSLNPLENEAILSVIGSFQTNSQTPGHLQLGSAWWFNDHISGMEKQMTDLAQMGVLGNFVGMLTDSRSFLSYTRHEYFRRILCNMIGGFVEEGKYPNDEKMLNKLITGICYENAQQYFNF